MANNSMELDLSNPSTDAGAELDNAPYVDTIEAVISSLDQGDGPRVSKTDEGHLWTFKYGSVDVFVQLTGETESDTLTVWSPVLGLPAKDELTLMKHLLEKNCNETLEARFGLSGDQILVIASRILQDISPAEISRIMTIVATIADDSDDDLQAQFGMA
ncbi:MAG: YbjN domain-containing protein [Leptolyngbyaceae cyanobacterium SM2_5_2]|nr:YbjN domain-containing protein [Leptolyngbyaceae cyanobacterium SM2_5_2]